MKTIHCLFSHNNIQLELFWNTRIITIMIFFAVQIFKHKFQTTAPKYQVSFIQKIFFVVDEKLCLNSTLLIRLFLFYFFFNLNLLFFPVVCVCVFALQDIDTTSEKQIKFGVVVVVHFISCVSYSRHNWLDSVATVAVALLSSIQFNFLGDITVFVATS